MSIKKPKLQSEVGVPLAQSFKETIALTLKEWFHSDALSLVKMIQELVEKSISTLDRTFWISKKQF